MNTQINPGDDFYQYINNEWLNDPENKIPPDYSSWGGFTKLYDAGLKKQIDLIKNLDKETNNEDESKIYAIWQASEKRFVDWNNTNIIQSKQVYFPIENELNILNSYYNNNDYLSFMAKYLHHSQLNGITNLLCFDKGSNLKNINHVVLDVSTSGLSLPSREYYTSSEFSDKLVLFRKHLENVKRILEQWVEIDDDFVDNVINFEYKIADYTLTPDQSREYDKYYTNTDLLNVYKKMNELNSLPRKQENYIPHDRNVMLTEKELDDTETLFEKMYQLFDFRNILETNYQQNFTDSDTQPDTNKYHISAYDGDGLRRCMKLLLNKDNYKVYHSYLQYQIIKSAHSYCSKELNEEFFDFYSRKLGGQEQQKSEEKRTINTVNLFAREMLGKLFVSKYFSHKDKHRMDQMIKNILNIMKSSLYDNDWLTAQTKLIGLDKLSTFRSKIGYPDIWKDYTELNISQGDTLYDISKKFTKWDFKTNFLDKINSILDRDEWAMTPQTVNAYFMPTQNEIVFPAAILQPPFFHQTIDSIDFNIQDELDMVNDLDIVTPANYGGIGAVIAHEITHGYDDKGRKFDKNGNLNDWWSEEDTDLFIKKTEIMVKSVIKYIYKDPDDGTEYKMNPKLTMGENLADIGGLSLSLKALLKELKDNNESEETITASLRVFFKSWANVWKQNINKDRRIMLLNVDPHAPTDFRGNLVNHMDLFYKVFNINETDKMYLSPDERMTMW